jgi:hypothetical protein
MSMASNSTTLWQARSPIAAVLTRDLWMPYVTRRLAEVGRWGSVLVAVGMLSLLAFVQLGQASYVARQVDTMQTLEGKLISLKQTNNSLRLRIAEQALPARIRAEARALGLGEAQDVEYVVVTLSEPSAVVGAHSPQGLSGVSQQPSLARLPGWLHGALSQFTDWITRAGTNQEVQASNLVGS